MIFGWTQRQVFIDNEAAKKMLEGDETLEAQLERLAPRRRDGQMSDLAFFFQDDKGQGWTDAEVR